MEIRTLKTLHFFFIIFGALLSEKSLGITVEMGESAVFLGTAGVAYKI
jgi:hypothetical protein